MKIVDNKDIDLLNDLMTDTKWYPGESFEDASISVIFINHFKLPYDSTVDVVETADLMKKHIATHGGTAFSYDWAIVDGVLYADGEIIKRVGSKDVRPNTDAFWRYIESHFVGEPVD